GWLWGRPLACRGPKAHSGRRQASGLPHEKSWDRHLACLFLFGRERSEWPTETWEALKVQLLPSAALRTPFGMTGCNSTSQANSLFFTRMSSLTYDSCLQLQTRVEFLDQPRQ